MLQLVIDSLVRPRTAARAVLALRPEPGVLVQAAAAITCIALVLGYVAMRLSGGGIDPVSAAVLRTPLVGAAIQISVMAVIAALTFRIGRAFGGRGDFWGAALVVVWLNGVTLVIQLLQLLLLALAPPLAGLLALATFLWLFWAFANFVAELHEFTSPVMVLGVVILTVVVLVFGLTLVAAIVGFTPRAAA